MITFSKDAVDKDEPLSLMEEELSIIIDDLWTISDKIDDGKDSDKFFAILKILSLVSKKLYD